MSLVQHRRREEKRARKIGKMPLQSIHSLVVGEDYVLARATAGMSPLRTTSARVNRTLLTG